MDHGPEANLVEEDNNWLGMQYIRDNTNYQNDTGGNHLRTTIKPTNPPSRMSTGTTVALSSCSSLSVKETTSNSDCSSPHQNIRRLVLLGDTSYGDDDHHGTSLEEPDQCGFSRLLRLSQRYRSRCLLLGTRYQCEDVKPSSCLLQDTSGDDSRTISSQQECQGSSRKTPPPLSSVSITTRHSQARNPRQPDLPSPPLTGSSQHRLRDVARKQEVSSEADQKPPPRKLSPSIKECSSVKTPYQATKIATLPYRPFAAEAPTVSRELRQDMTDQLSQDAFAGLDPEDVRRQQEILEDIQERNRCAKTAPGKVSRPCGVIMAAECNTRPSSVSLQQALYHQERPVQARRNSSGQSIGPSSSSNAMVGDQFARLSNGKKVRVKGSRHTYKSIIQGRATLVQCPGCRTVSQISDTAKLLYCTACQQVSPIGTATTPAANVADPSAAAAALARCDDQIACVLQRQEINVAHIMKQAKQIAG